MLGVQLVSLVQKNEAEGDHIHQSITVLVVDLECLDDVLVGVLMDEGFAHQVQEGLQSLAAAHLGLQLAGCVVLAQGTSQLGKVIQVGDDTGLGVLVELDGEEGLLILSESLVEAKERERELENGSKCEELRGWVVEYRVWEGLGVCALGLALRLKMGVGGYSHLSSSFKAMLIDNSLNLHCKLQPYASSIG